MRGGSCAVPGMADWITFSDPSLSKLGSSSTTEARGESTKKKGKDRPFLAALATPDSTSTRLSKASDLSQRFRLAAKCRTTVNHQELTLAGIQADVVETSQRHKIRKTQNRGGCSRGDKPRESPRRRSVHRRLEEGQDL
jgi:hypothetical protein